MTWYFVPSTCVPATEDSSSDSDSLGCPPEPFVTLNGIAMPRPLSWQGWKRRSWISRLCGLILSPSTVQRGVEAWISSLPGSRANRSPLLVNDVELTMTAGSGPILPGSLLTWDRATSSWRTSPDLFGPGCLTSSVILPASGSMQSGECSARLPLVPPTSGNASGSWATPRAVNPPRASSKGTAGPTLNEMACGRDGRTPFMEQVRAWPTPMAHDAKGMVGSDRNSEDLATAAISGMPWPTPVARDDQKSPAAYRRMREETLGRSGAAAETVSSLTVAAKLWATPTATDSKGSGNGAAALEDGWQGTLTDQTVRAGWATPNARDFKGPPSEKSDYSSLPKQVVGLLPETTSTDGGSTSPPADLNPRFVAALMGVPPGWLTPFTSVGMDSYQQWLRAHSLP